MSFDVGQDVAIIIERLYPSRSRAQIRVAHGVRRALCAAESAFILTCDN